MNRPRGMTIVELLVVIGIIGLLVAMLLPAVQAAREAGRRAQCQNNLRQVATAVLLHEEAHGHMPTGGWGNRWVGDSDRGFGIEQPGGWIYNVLPYIEETQTRDLGRNATLEQKHAAMLQLLTSPNATFTCPSRRSPSLSEYGEHMILRNGPTPPVAAKNDYAVCGGDVVLNGGSGPPSANPEDLREYEWPSHEQFTGVGFVLSVVRVSQIADGTSKTYLAGEKLLHGDAEDNWGDDQALYVGDDADVRRWTAEPPRRDGSGGVDYQWFGSPHAAGCSFALCDGSVQLVAYDIDPHVHRAQGNRWDGRP